MKKASISYTKNNLSRVIGMVREGHTVLVTDRDVPVARIEPVDQAELSREDRLLMLARRGIVRLPKRPLDVEEFLRRERPVIREGSSVVRAVIEEREEGR